VGFFILLIFINNGTQRKRRKPIGIEYYSIIEYTKEWAEDVFHLNLKRTEPLMASSYIKMI
jgi:hypothetical protein